MIRGKAVSRVILRFIVCAAVLASVWLVGCQSGSPQSSSQTHFLAACDDDDQCGDLSCHCGVCTTVCGAATDGAGGALGTCSEDGAVCIPKTDPGAVALCEGSQPEEPLCLVPCGDSPCSEGTHCFAGVCMPTRPPSTEIVVDTSLRYQSLIGIGASLGYGEDAIVSHPRKSALYDAMFADSGFDLIRIRNRFNGENPASLEAASEIVSEATARMGRSPTLFLSLYTPPEALKANSAQFCFNLDPDCTLVRDEVGGFDYAGFAEHVRASLQAYDAVGLVPDLISLQGTPDWVPSDETPAETCRFLPEEGTTTIPTPEGEEIEVELPGYSEAFLRAQTEIATLESEYGLVGPETISVASTTSYVNALPSNSLQALAVRFFPDELYAPTNGDLEDLRTFGQVAGLPIIQIEMGQDGLETAVSAQRAFTLSGASGYLQDAFVALVLGEAADPIGNDGETFELNQTYFALAHFAKSTDPGWVRVEAQGGEDLLVSAWVAPDDEALTLVIVNSGEERQDVELTLPAPWSERLANGGLVRTVFGADEALADLGAIADHRVVALPAGSIATVTIVP